MILVVVLLLAAGAAAGGTLLAAGPDTDGQFTAALRSQGLQDTYPSDSAAVDHAKQLCRDLVAGKEPKGYAADKVAVQYYCPDYLTRFTVVPTPQEQQRNYLDALRQRGQAGVFASDAAAVAHAQSFCDGLRNGGEQQGLPQDLTGVEIYCPEFAAGFHVLKTITVRGTFTLLDSDPSYYYPAIVEDNASCMGYNGYSDITPGTQVLLKDGSGNRLSEGVLGTGTGSAYRCSMSFELPGVTEGANDYVVTVSHRGDVHYSFTQLDTEGVDLTLGS